MPGHRRTLSLATLTSIGFPLLACTLDDCNGEADVQIPAIAPASLDIAKVRAFARNELPNIGGERLDYVCPKLARPLLFAAPAIVVNEVASSGSPATENLLDCIDYSVAGSADVPALLQTLRSLSPATDDGRRLRDSILKKLEHPNPDWP